MSPCCPTPDSRLPTPIQTGLVLLCLATALIGSGCDFQRTVELKAPTHESKLVVNGEIVPGLPWRIDVSRSVGAFEPGTPSDERQTVTDASVTVLQGDERLGELPLDSLNQYSTRKFPPSPGRQYTVRVQAPELGTVTATDRVPQGPSAHLTTEKIETGDDYYDRALVLTIDDPSETDNYYHVQVQKNGYRRDSTAIDTLGLTDVRFLTRNRSIVDEMGQVLEEANAYRGREATFRDVLFGGTEHRIRLRVPEGNLYLPDQQEGDNYPRLKYMLYVSALSEDAYQFDHTKRLFQRTEENPFAEPVNVHSNVEDGYGIVAGRHTDTLEVEVTLE